MADQPGPKPTEPLRLPRVLWVALFVSTLVYIVVLELAAVQVEGEWQGLVLLFAIAGVGTAGASLLAPRFVPRSKGAYLVALILSLALAESVCILGLVLGFLGAPATVVMPFFFVTWVLMIIRFPTKEKLDAFDA